MMIQQFGLLRSVDHSAYTSTTRFICIALNLSRLRFVMNELNHRRLRNDGRDSTMYCMPTLATVQCPR